MLFNLIDLLTRPEAYVCVWRDGELFVEPVAATSAATTESTQQTSKEADGLESWGIVPPSHFGSTWGSLKHPRAADRGGSLRQAGDR